MNRKGATGYWLNFTGFVLIWLIILGGLVGAVLTFYGQDYAFKKVESVLLFDTVKVCFENNDFFDSNFKNNFFSKCGLNKNVLESEHLVFVKNLDSEEKEEFFVGVYDYQTQCELTDKKNNFAKCKKGIIVKNGERFELIVGSNQNSRGVVR